MEILTKEQEETLQRLIDLCENTKKEINCSRDGFGHSIIEYLLKIGYLENHIKQNVYGLYVISLTEEEKNYFRNKQSYMQKLQENKTLEIKREKKEDKRFWISIGVSIGAFIIAVLSLVLQYTVG